MNELGATYDLVTQLTQSTELRRFKADRKLSAAKQLDGTSGSGGRSSGTSTTSEPSPRRRGDFQQLMRQTRSTSSTAGLIASARRFRPTPK